MPTYAAPSRSVVELDVFTGTAASASTFGLKQFRVSSREPGPPATPWADIGREDYYSGDGIAVVLPGTVFERQAIETDTPGEMILGGWRPVGDVLAMESDYEAVALNRSRTVAPGANMKNPLGLVLRDSEGNTIRRPAVGEQDLDPWTGEPLFDSEGQPVLVAE